MKTEKIIAWISTIIGLILATAFFLRWHPEHLWQNQSTPVTMAEIEENLAKDYSGMTAGHDIFRLTGAKDFEDTWSYHNYMTAEPIGIVSTDVYSLKPWVDPYIRSGKRHHNYTGKRKAEIITSKLNVWEDYNPYYLLELPDHSYILAQIPSEQADAIARGKKITLPIGRKTGMTATAASCLSKICEEYQVDTSGVYYAFNDEWEKKHYHLSFMIRFAAAAAICLLSATLLITIGNKIFRVNSA